MKILGTNPIHTLRGMLQHINVRTCRFIQHQYRPNQPFDKSFGERSRKGKYILDTKLYCIYTITLYLIFIYQDRVACYNWDGVRGRLLCPHRNSVRFRHFLETGREQHVQIPRVAVWNIPKSCRWPTVRTEQRENDRQTKRSPLSSFGILGDFVLRFGKHVVIVSPSAIGTLTKATLFVRQQFDCRTEKH